MVMARISATCQKICDGDFEARLTSITQTGELADVQYKVNDMIDRCDAFVREASASLDAVCRNIYYRRILLGGLQGGFRVAATRINEAVDGQQKRDAERARLAKAQVDATAEQGHVIDQFSGALRRLAGGDLTCSLADMPENYLLLQREFNGALDRLRKTLRATVGAAREVTGAAAEISASAMDLSERTEQQAAGLEQTSASMEEISASVKKNAKSADRADRLAAGAREAADHGAAVVASTVEAMQRIEESSKRIADIIGIIDEIARQTNLLALNAAVEAARAGDAGRGFSVVATEVRSLAQRSSQAANGIKNLINNSSTQVKDGVELANRTGLALDEIAASIKSVANIVADIAIASNEQAIAIEQVNKALVQMDEVTQRNSSLAEENVATAKKLEGQSAALSEQVAFFQIDRPTSFAPRAMRFG